MSPYRYFKNELKAFLCISSLKSFLNGGISSTSCSRYLCTLVCNTSIISDTASANSSQLLELASITALSFLTRISLVLCFKIHFHFFTLLRRVNSFLSAIWPVRPFVSSGNNVVFALEPNRFSNFSSWMRAFTYQTLHARLSCEKSEIKSIVYF